MKKTEVSHLKDKDDNLVGIKVKTEEETFTVPVVDVRLSENKRNAAKAIIKAANIQRGSKHMKTSYSLWGYKYN
jgi:hypothetical protein